jgi:2-keto-4-pentenoate hydratase/2-oxohepta-3-ene-1,7-dioic acid hydratase in catechol pathway
MVFTVADRIVPLSGDTTLLAYTLLPPSTPAGVSFTRQPWVFFAAGDGVGIEIEGIGRLTNREEVA